MTAGSRNPGRAADSSLSIVRFPQRICELMFADRPDGPLPPSSVEFVTAWVLRSTLGDRAGSDVLDVAGDVGVGLIARGGPEGGCGVVLAADESRDPPSAGS